MFTDKQTYQQKPQVNQKEKTKQKKINIFCFKWPPAAYGESNHAERDKLYVTVEVCMNTPHTATFPAQQTLHHYQFLMLANFQYLKDRQAEVYVLVNTAS